MSLGANDHSEERDLVAGCIANDRRYQERFYRRFAPVAMRTCRRFTQDREEQLEIVNSGMLRVFQKLDQFQFRGSLEGWVRRIIFHTLSDYFRKANRRMAFLELSNLDHADSQDALPNLYLEDVHRMIDLLPEATREVFLLYAVEGYNHREIGERLAISEGTSKWHLSNARKKLKKIMAKQNPTNTNRHAG
jgi:RNA polymerase sigma-70 factor (ECF subfamily)